MFFQQGEELCAEVHPSVASLLILNVSNCLGRKRSTHAERAIALLPCEVVTLLVGPFGRIRLDSENCLGHSQTGRDLNEEMNVILDSTHGMNKDSESIANTGQVRPHSWLKFFGDGFAAVLGAEHDVNHVLRVGVGQVSHLRR